MPIMPLFLSFFAKYIIYFMVSSLNFINSFLYLIHTCCIERKTFADYQYISLLLQLVQLVPLQKTYYLASNKLYYLMTMIPDKNLQHANLSVVNQTEPEFNGRIKKARLRIFFAFKEQRNHHLLPYINAYIFYCYISFLHYNTKVFVVTLEQVCK